MHSSSIQTFMHDPVAAWNSGDKKAFFDAYRLVAPNGLQIEYVGRGPATEGWPVLDAMWAQQSAKIEIEEVLLTINGTQAAAHNRNKLHGTAVVIDTIEIYHFDEGRLFVVYHLKPPEMSPEQLQLFPGFADSPGPEA